jgi:hypothetical protein
MPVSVGLLYRVESFSKGQWSGRRCVVRGLLLELNRKQLAKMRRWLGASSALALMCSCISPRILAQDSAAGSKAEPSKSKTVVAKKPATKAHGTSHSTAGTHSKSSAASATRGGKSKYASSRKSGKKKTTARGQQKIDPERAQAIQEALIREHYLNGEAAGTWNQSSEEAMRRYQADHGWQSKTVPDSRALISLGLGPSHDHLLNPESAMVTGPFSTRSASLTPTSHSADPGAQMSTRPAETTSPRVTTTPAHDASVPQ